jgi:two-component system cell cycle response regulator
MREMPLANTESAGASLTVPMCEGPARVLVAEDDPVARRVVVSFLGKWGYEVVAVGDGAEAWQILGTNDAPRLALLDWMLPGLEGVDVCRKVRENAARPYVYILLLTAVSQKQDLLTALDAGADDYLVKPFDAAELRARLHVGRRILAAQDELIAAREALRYQATHDPLTGLWNHGEVLNILDRELDRAFRSRQAVAVLMADIDHFKEVNDRYGHLMGDEVLREVGRRVLSCVRPYDAVGRYGGEEFIIVVPAIDAGPADALARRIGLRLSERSFDTPGGAIPITASLGVAVSSPDEAPASAALVRAADLALYRAKRAGRNRTEMCTSEEMILAPWLAGAESAIGEKH